MYAAHTHAEWSKVLLGLRVLGLMTHCGVRPLDLGLGFMVLGLFGPYWSLKLKGMDWALLGLVDILGLGNYLGLWIDGPVKEVCWIRNKLLGFRVKPMQGLVGHSGMLDRGRSDTPVCLTWVG